MKLFVYNTIEEAQADSKKVNDALGYPNELAISYSPILTDGDKFALFSDNVTKGYISCDEIDYDDSWIDYKEPIEN